MESTSAGGIRHLPGEGPVSVGAGSSRTRRRYLAATGQIAKGQRDRHPQVVCALSPEVMRINEAGWDLAANMKLQATLRALREGATASWAMEEFIQYLLFYKRRRPKTVDDYRRQLNFMARHSIAPVQLHASRAELIESFSMYVTVREQVEGCPPTSLKNDHHAIRALGAFLSIPDNVWPTCPTVVARESRWVPSPEQVYELLQSQFGSTRSYEHHLVRYMLAYTFGMGIRPPSEVLSARVQDIDLENGVIIITEAKKGGRRREQVIEPRWLCDAQNRLSLKRWIEGPRQLCDPKADVLFPNVDGKPFPTTEACGQFLRRHVSGNERREWRCWDGEETRPGPRFPWYQPYISRHWSCNARLIATARERKGQVSYDWNSVARWHGHESVKMTMNTYARSVEVNHKKYGENWLTRAFARPEKKGG